MRHLLLLVIALVPFLSFSQQVKSIVDTYDHKSRIYVDQVKLKSSVFISFRTIGENIYLYIEGSGEAVGMINQNDVAIFVTEKDSIIAKSTGTQDYHDRSRDFRHEYTITEDGLRKLSASPIKTVIQYTTSGISQTNIPEARQRLLMNASLNLLKEYEKR